MCRLSPRTTTGSDILSPRLSRFAIVATQLLRRMLPVSAKASSSRSTMSSRGSCRPTTARTSSRLLASGKISSAAGEGSAEVLAHRHEVRVIRLRHELDRLILGQNLDSGNGEQNLVLHHLTQA